MSTNISSEPEIHLVMAVCLQLWGKLRKHLNIIRCDVNADIKNTWSNTSTAPYAFLACTWAAFSLPRHYADEQQRYFRFDVK